MFVVEAGIILCIGVVSVSVVVEVGLFCRLFVVFGR